MHTITLFDILNPVEHVAKVKGCLPDLARGPLKRGEQLFAREDVKNGPKLQLSRCMPSASGRRWAKDHGNPLPC